MRRAISALALTVSLFPVIALARVKEPAPDFCSLLPISHLEKVYEQPFGPVEKTTPPPATSNVTSATECDYNSQRKGQRKIVFIVFEDTSAAAAKENFHRFMTMFGTTGLLDNVGDLAYTDSNQAIHVLRGRLRYYISVTPTNNNSEISTAAKRPGNLGRRAALHFCALVSSPGKPLAFNHRVTRYGFVGALLVYPEPRRVYPESRSAVRFLHPDEFDRGALFIGWYAGRASQLAKKCT